MLIPATKSSLHGTVHTSKACGTLAMLKIFIGSMGKARPDGSIHDTMVFGALLTVSLVVTLEFTCSQLGMFEGYRSRKLTLVSRPKRTASTALGTAPTTNTNKKNLGVMDTMYLVMMRNQKKQCQTADSPIRSGHTHSMVGTKVSTIDTFRSTTDRRGLIFTTISCNRCVGCLGIGTVAMKPFDSVLPFVS